ncbi:MAG TPA: carboxypeptidase-like regulatory domain-containing protein [Pirellulales bacterium]|nr:carboxypeptidase-like regulatory domain-containing protein [Pirellulales bacterium]
MRALIANMTLLAAMAALAGCSRSSGQTAFVETPVYGTVTLDGQPLSAALVSFVSTDAGGTLMALTGADGSYHLQAAPRTRATCQGHYRVTISKPLKSDGTPLAADEPPMARAGRELAPARYLLSAFTPLEANVGAEGGRFDFALVSN